MAVFKIKLEDKAAFLNRLEKQDVGIDSTQIKDNKLEGYFEVVIDKPEQLEVAKSILKQSPKINTIKEMETNKKKMTKDELKEMIRQELQGTLSEKKKSVDKEKMDESNLNEDMASEIIPILATLLGVGGTLAAAFYRDLKGKSKEEREQILRSISGQIEKSKGQGGSTY